MIGASARNQNQTFGHRVLVPMVPGSWSNGGSQHQVEYRTHVPAGQQPQGPLSTQLPLSWCVWVWDRWQEGGVRTMQRVHASTGGEMRVETKTSGRVHVCLLDIT